MSLNATIDPTPCKNDCGYWGDQLTEYYCSACYKEHLTKKQEGQQQMKQQQVSTMEVFHESDSHDAQHLDQQQQDQQDQQQQQTHKNDEADSSTFSVASAESSADNSPCLNASHSSSSSSSPSSSSSSSHVTTSGEVVEAPCSPTSLLGVASQTLNKELEEHSRKISTPKKSIQCCHVCKKNVRLYGFDCRCGLLLCGVHRYHDKHNCSFDYASSAISELRTSNAKVVADKLKDRI